MCHYLLYHIYNKLSVISNTNINNNIHCVTSNKLIVISNTNIHNNIQFVKCNKSYFKN